VGRANPERKRKRRFALSVKETFETALAILVSIGGGGTLILAFAGWFGKTWADRALEHQKHKYEELNLQLQNQYERAARRLQLELDTIGLIDKLRTEGQFERLAGLWKRMSILRVSFDELGGTFRIWPVDKEFRQKWDSERFGPFESAFDAAQLYLQQEGLFIPKQIADVAAETLTLAARVKTWHGAAPRTGDDEDARYRQFAAGHLDEFKRKMVQIESLMRAHVEGTGQSARWQP
jgi:hypothetical protein